MRGNDAAGRLNAGQPQAPRGTAFSQVRAVRPGTPQFGTGKEAGFQLNQRR
jgi:hypothetical protein